MNSYLIKISLSCHSFNDGGGGDNTD